MKAQVIEKWTELCNSSVASSIAFTWNEDHSETKLLTSYQIFKGGFLQKQDERNNMHCSPYISSHTALWDGINPHNKNIFHSKIKSKCLITQIWKSFTHESFSSQIKRALNALFIVMEAYEQREENRFWWDNDYMLV